MRQYRSKNWLTPEMAAIEVDYKKVGKRIKEECAGIL
jgi:hypothetical protein